MTNQVNQAFEKWAMQYYGETVMSVNPPQHYAHQNEYMLDTYRNAYEGWQARESEINSLKQRVAELESWKNQAITVESEWDLQSVGKALNIPLGHSIRANILPKIAELTASKNQLREALESAIECTDDYNMIDRMDGKQYLKHEIFEHEIKLLEELRATS